MNILLFEPPFERSGTNAVFLSDLLSCLGFKG